jgi:arylformamidase
MVLPATVLRIPEGPREEITPENFQRHGAVLTRGAKIVSQTGWHRQFEADNFYSVSAS